MLKKWMSALSLNLSKLNCKLGWNITNCQHYIKKSGNRKMHSKGTLNILVSDMILDAMYRKELTAVVLLDLSKAFDSIEHLLLLKKLHSMACLGKLWIGLRVTSQTELSLSGLLLKSDTAIQRYSDTGTGTWNRNLEPEPGTGTWNRNLEPEPGTGTWNRNLEPEPGTGTWNRA
jgi:hypothetical protein